MAARMFDLPGVPPFPVYGLGREFDGYRWLVIWNDRERLYTVSLGHGHPGEPGEDRAWLTVSTYLKTPFREINDGPLVGKGPTGYQDALFGALIELGDRVLPRRPHPAEWVTEEINAADWGSADERNAPESHGPGWTSGTTTVDGEGCTSVSRHLGTWWARLVDLPTVAVAITGPDSMSGLAASIVDVRDELADYA